LAYLLLHSLFRGILDREPPLHKPPKKRRLGREMKSDKLPRDQALEEKIGECQ